MKYKQFTKEQLEGLHEEFAVFLASQQIEKKEWEDIKKNKPEVAEEELNIFSDLVWGKVLDNTNYIEHFSDTSLNLFKCGDYQMQRIVVKVNKEGVDLLKQEGFNWFLDHSNDETIEYLKGQKKYDKERNIEIFDLIQKGGIISKGELFEGILKIIQ
ncbi:MAG: DUF6495 family protein [Bacteroidota bacterium]